jgi:replication factor A1
MRRFSKRRGRPHSKYGSKISQVEIKALESLARIVQRNDIDPDEFLEAIVTAWDQDEITYQELTIKCRKRKQNSAIFLFIIRKKAVGQFSIPKLILQDNDLIKNYVEALPPKKLSTKKAKTEKPKIKDLEKRMDHVSLKAKVLETSKPKLIYTRYGTEAYLSNVLLADETGTIKLTLWNQNINRVSVDDVIELENVNVIRFRGERQLRLRRKSILTILEGEEFPSIEHLDRLIDPK